MVCCAASTSFVLLQPTDHILVQNPTVKQVDRLFNKSLNMIWFALISLNLREDCSRLFDLDNHLSFWKDTELMLFFSFCCCAVGLHPSAWLSRQVAALSRNDYCVVLYHVCPCVVG